MPSKIPHERTGFDRRQTLIGLAAGLMAAGWTSPVLALSNAAARHLIDQLVGDLNKIINSGGSKATMYREFENLFSKYADVPIIARSSLGVAWRRASAGQRRRYTAAFRGYMARKYGNRFREFIGGKIVVTGVHKVKSGYLVSSVAHLKGQAPFAVDWQVSDKSGKNKMFNLFIEGISLLATERTEVAAMLDKRRGNIDKLIRDLKTAS